MPRELLSSLRGYSTLQDKAQVKFSEGSTLSCFITTELLSFMKIFNSLIAQVPISFLGSLSISDNHLQQYVLSAQHLRRDKHIQLWYHLPKRKHWIPCQKLYYFKIVCEPIAKEHMKVSVLRLSLHYHTHRYIFHTKHCKYSSSLLLFFSSKDHIHTSQSYIWIFFKITIILLISQYYNSTLVTLGHI